MIQENELIMLMLGLGVLFFLISNYGRIKRYPFAHILIAAFGFLLFGWCFTLLEGFFLARMFNVAEHLCYLAGSGCLARWVWRMGNSKMEIR